MEQRVRTVLEYSGEFTSAAGGPGSLTGRGLADALADAFGGPYPAGSLRGGAAPGGVRGGLSPSPTPISPGRRPGLGMTLARYVQNLSRKGGRPPLQGLSRAPSEGKASRDESYKNLR